MNFPAIQLRDIEKHYTLANTRSHALKNINLSIQANEYVAITGPSGSGKSTLMNILGCLDSPSNGKYLLNGTDVSLENETKLAKIRNHSVGFVFQSFNLLPKATAMDNIIQPLVYRMMPSKERISRAAQALRRVGLADKASYFPNQLSGGQRQRVAIARALVTEPDILLADEPTGNLDSKTSYEIMNLFNELHDSGNTIILVTHEQDIANYCRRIIRLVDGEIAQDEFSTNKKSIDHV